MLDFRVLGALDLRTPEGVGIRSILAQPKRVALLTYLVLQGGDSFVRRDTLLALFWPESDTEHARASLRKGLHHLRQSLGEGVLVTRGDEEVGIDRARLRCDATELLRALERGELAAALDLYRGELLEGFHVSAAPEFDEWLEARRAELRERASGAAWALALEAEEAGAHERATQLTRRAVALSRDEEPAVHKLIALQGRLGDREGALRTYAAFAERWQREYDAEPSLETQALVEALRAAPASPGPTAPPPPAPPPMLGEGRLADPAAAPEPESGRIESPLSQNGAALRAPDNRERGLGGEGAVRGEEAKGRGGHARSGSERLPRRLLVISLLALVLLVGSAALLARLRSTPAVPVSSNVVAVLPFTYHGSGEYGYLGEGMVRLLSTNLNGVGELRSVDPRALLSVLEQAEVDLSDPQAGRTLAGRFGAGQVVLGHIIEAGGRLRITAVVYDGARGGVPDEEVTVEGEGAQLLDLVDELTARLLAIRSTAPAQRLTRIAALTTHSMPALKAFLEGESENQRGRYSAAVEALQRAVELDSTFALAYYRLGIAASWAQLGEVEALGKAGALRFRERLSLRDRQLLDAWLGQAVLPPEQTEGRYQRIVDEYPDDLEAWFQLGEVRFHWKGILGSSIQQSRPAFERVLSYEPDNAGALIHLARLAALERDTARLDSLVAHILRLDPAEHHRVEMEALQAFSRDDPAAQARVRERFRSVNFFTQWLAITSLATYGNRFAEAIELGHEAFPPAHDTLATAAAHVQLAVFELARGRWSASQEHLAALERTYPAATVVQYWAEHTGFPFLRLPPQQLEALRAQIARSPMQPDTIRRLSPVGLPASYRQYLLGLLSLRLGDPVAALRHATELTRPQESVGSSLGAEYARLLRAQVAWTGGQARDALDLLGSPRITVRSEAGHSWQITNGHERWLRAELLRTLGREEEALGWYGSFPATQGNDFLYLAPSHLRRAEIHERRGERQQAAAHYRRFVELWQDADPELQPLVTRARERLTRLEE